MKGNIYTIKFEVVDEVGGQAVLDAMKNGKDFHGLKLHGISVGDLFSQQEIGENALKAIRDRNFQHCDFSTNEYINSNEEYEDEEVLASEACTMIDSINNITQNADDAERFYNATPSERYEMMV